MANTIKIKRGNGVPTSLQDGELGLNKTNNYLYIGNGSNVVSPFKYEALDKIYPIGSIYMSTTNISPASFLGGTWSQIIDTFLFAAGGSYTAGSTGGSASHTLTINEIPAHNHTGSTASEGGHTHTATTSSDGNHNHTASSATAGEHRHDGWGAITHGSGSTAGAESYANVTSWREIEDYNFMNSAGSHTHTITVGSTGDHTHTLTTSSNGSHTHTVTISNSGGGRPSQRCRHILRSICGNESKICHSTVNVSYVYGADSPKFWLKEVL